MTLWTILLILIINENNMKVYKLGYLGSTLILTKQELLDFLDFEMDSMNIHEGSSFTVQCIDMTKEQLDNLPEFEGF